MKKNILIFLFGISVAFNIAATSGITEMVVKPKIPTYVCSKYFMNSDMDLIPAYVLSKSREGYIVKTIVGFKYDAVVVMEKY